MLVRLLPAACCLLSLWSAPPLRGQPSFITEASGVVRQGDTLLIVDDGQPGAYFRLPLDGQKGPLIPLNPERLERVPVPNANLVTDLEAIDLLADGRVVILSERLRALFSAEGIVAEYASSFAEFGGRGLEGLAIRPLAEQRSQVAVLSEGGYPDYERVPAQLRQAVGRKPLRPVIQIHRLLPRDHAIRIEATHLVELDVPLPAGRPPRAQRFRAPDLVWHRGPDGKLGFIVLLTSLNSEGKRQYLYHWLQRFALDGSRVGEPLDLNQVAPPKLKGANWEGMGWFEEGESLVLVYESHPDPRAEAFVLELPPEWKQHSSQPAVR